MSSWTNPAFITLAIFVLSNIIALIVAITTIRRDLHHFNTTIGGLAESLTVLAESVRDITNEQSSHKEAIKGLNQAVDDIRKRTFRLEEHDMKG